MKKLFVGVLLALSCMSANAQEKYFLPAGTEAVSPDGEGFIRRWTVLEPTSKTNRSNTVFVDSYLREVFAKEYFNGGGHKNAAGGRLSVPLEELPAYFEASLKKFFKA